MYIPLLVFTEQEPRYQSYIQYYSDRIWPACNANIDPLKGIIRTYACPSDSESTKPSHSNTVMRMSYHTSWGDAVYNVHESAHNPRGFAAGARLGNPPTYYYISTADINDGTSNTLAISEGACAAQAGDINVKGGTAIETTVKPSTCNTRRNGAMLTGTVATTDTSMLRGSSFADGRPRSNGIQTILPPNSPSCASADGNPGQASTNGFMTASSYHPGLVNALVGDASVRPVIDAIDVGNSTVFSATYNTSASEPTGISPFGIWGAFGTIAGGESVELP
jgi:hypothetical protein